MSFSYVILLVTLYTHVSHIIYSSRSLISWSSPQFVLILSSSLDSLLVPVFLFISISVESVLQSNLTVTVVRKKLLETAECWWIKKLLISCWAFAQKLLLAGRGVLLKKNVWARRFHTKHKGRLIRLQEFPHCIFLFHFCATVLYMR